MRVWWIAFALGVVVLQRQAALPGWGGWVGGAVVLAGCGALLAWCARRRRTRSIVALRWMLCACAACAIGFGYAAARAEWRLRDGLPVEREGRDIVVTGVISGLPVIDDTGARLLLAVESNDAGLARFPPLIRLSWRTYGAPAARNAMPDLRAAQRWRLVSFESYEPLMIRPNARGKITFGQKVRASLSRWFFEDRISPVTKGELESSHGEHH